MSDPHSRPRDGDRRRATEEVDKAYAEGRITAADRALRVGNIENAATLAELEVMVRDLRLEQGEVAPQMVPPPPAQRPSQSQPISPTTPPQQPSLPGSSLPSPSASLSAGSSGSGLRAVVLAVVALVVLISVGAVFLVANVVGDVVGDVEDGIGNDPFGFTDPAKLPSGQPTDLAVDPLDPPTGPVDRLALTEAGLRWFVGRYEKQFGTTRTLGVTVWADRASIDRSVHAGRRLERWSYNDGQFQKFGTVTTNSRRASVVDLRQLRLKPLVANILRAKRTLNVAKPETIYVIIGDDALGAGPEARIYVSNKYNESAYMATTFGGRIVRTFPFQR